MVRKLDRDSLNGFVSPTSFLQGSKLEVLNTAGNVIVLNLIEVKAVYFVRDFNVSEPQTRKTFTTRPRTEGLWVRLNFKDGEILEGLMASDLAVNPPEGYNVTPPDLRGNTQRIFVPHSALESLRVLAVIGAGRRARPEMDGRQVSMFEQ